ncbi:MAG: hypothetical protein IKV13_02955 [Akkermansia sp.]|nr:hypothetical protein [Akkermansia sp.]
MVLHGASNQLTLTVYDAAGNETHKWLLNTPEERAEVPLELIERLQKLR